MGRMSTRASKTLVSRARGRDRAAPASVVITHPDRPVYPKQRIAKGDVADYYRAVAARMLPELAGRPLSLLRCPDGLAGACFFQKHHADSLGADVAPVALTEKDGGRARYVAVNDARGLQQLVQMNTLEFHPWGARVDAPDRPDRLVFDLDPGDGVPWKTVVAAAREVRAKLRAAGLESFLRLSGGKGLHVVVPIARKYSWDRAKAFCEAFAGALAARRPERYIATASKAKREGLIFIDWLRNARGATSVTNWSLRARDGAPVAMPLRWTELGRTRSGGDFDLRRALKRAATLKADPWEGIARLRQSLP